MKMFCCLAVTITGDREPLVPTKNLFSYKNFRFFIGNDHNSQGSQFENLTFPLVTTREVIQVTYDVKLHQWKQENFYNHLRNYTKCIWKSNYYKIFAPQGN